MTVPLQPLTASSGESQAASGPLAALAQRSESTLFQGLESHWGTPWLDLIGGLENIWKTWVVNRYRYRYYLVGGLEHDFYLSIYWECHHPN